MALKYLEVNAQSQLNLAEHIIRYLSKPLGSYDTTNVKLNDEGKRRKKKNEGINRRKETLVKKAFELGEFDGIDVALIICKYGRYTTYRPRDYVSRQPSFAEIVSRVAVYFKYTAILIEPP